MHGFPRAFKKKSAIIGALTSSAAQSPNSFAPFPIRREDEIVRLRLERTILYPLIPSTAPNAFATVFEHVSCAGRVRLVEDTMRTLLETRCADRDCIFAFDEGGEHVVCMWLRRRKVALVTSIAHIRLHPKKLYTRMKVWLDHARPSLVVVQSAMRPSSLCMIARDFDVRFIDMCQNASVREHPSLPPLGIQRVPHLVIRLCDPASSVCEDTKQLLAVCDTVLAPIGSLATRDEPLRRTEWSRNGIQLRIRTLCSHLRSIVKYHPPCQQWLQQVLISLSAIPFAIWFSSAVQPCSECVMRIRFCFGRVNSV